MATLSTNRYGKSKVRLMKVTRAEGVRYVKDWTVQILLEGEFEASFLDGDNSKILPTDTMKNTVYSLARDSKAASMEEFAEELIDFLLAGNPQVSGTEVDMVEKNWSRVRVDGKPDDSTFQHFGPAVFTARVERIRGEATQIRSGVAGLVLLKTARSGFVGFIKDRLTTLPEVEDRLLGTEAEIVWSYQVRPVDFDGARSAILETLLTTFAEHDSLSVQQTLFAMGEAVLERHAEIGEVDLSMPNRHCNLVNLSPFGQDNPNQIFVPTDEPHGTIQAKIVRG